MSRTHPKLAISAALISLLPAAAAADQTFFSTGAPDGLMATATRPDSPGKFEIESADDVILGKKTSVTDATFIGLMPAGASVSSVVVEFYRVFPNDSNVGRTNGAPDFSTPNVPTRVNSPSDVAFDERDASSGLSFSTTLLNASFSALNSVQPGGIHPLPGIFTGGNGPVTGQEVEFDVTFATPLGDFLWLSAARPISGGTGPFVGDLQSWTRDDSDGGIEPDWLRVGTDITHQGPFNAAFSLSGSVIPEPSTWAMMLLGFAGLGFAGYRHARKTGPASA